MGENRYKPFKDKKMGSTWVRRGANQKEVLYIGEKAFLCDPLKFTGSIMVPYWTYWTLIDQKNNKSSLIGQYFFTLLVH
jgi:hypothetical protein